MIKTTKEDNVLNRQVLGHILATYGITEYKIIPYYASYVGDYFDMVFEFMGIILESEEDETALMLRFSDYNRKQYFEEEVSMNAR